MASKKDKSKDESKKSDIMFFDLETTGLPTRLGYNLYAPPSHLDMYDSCRVVQMSWQVYKADGTLVCSRNFIVRPHGFTISDKIAEIHGITHKKAVSKGIPLGFITGQMVRDIKNVKFMIAHNVLFDKNVLMSELIRREITDLYLEMADKEYICTGENTRKLVNITSGGMLKMPKLPELYEFCFNETMKDHHNAEFDTENLAKIFFHLRKNHKVFLETLPKDVQLKISDEECKKDTTMKKVVEDEKEKKIKEKTKTKTKKKKKECKKAKKESKKKTKRSKSKDKDSSLKTKDKSKKQKTK